jgi:6-phospho-3-hexuloisomerase
MNTATLYEENSSMIVKEISAAIRTIDPKEVNALADLICAADKVFVIGVGRVLMMLQAFSKRLNHLGIQSWYVGEVNEPAITSSDLLIVGSGSGESVIPLQIARLAHSYGAKVAHIGSNRKSSMEPYENLFVRIPCPTKLAISDEIHSDQPMTSLFEQCVLLLGDSIVCMIIRKKKITDLHLLWKQHANLE